MNGHLSLVTRHSSLVTPRWFNSAMGNHGFGRLLFTATVLACCALLWGATQALAQGSQPTTTPQACQANASLVTSQDNSISNEPVVSKDGRRLAFWSTVNELGLNSDGSIELFVAATDPVTPTNSDIVSQVSESLGNILGGFNIMPDIVSFQSAGVRRTLVVFASDRDLIPGRNPDGGFEIFLAQTEPSFWIAQVTDTERSASILPGMSDVLSDGRTVRIVFLSDADDRENLPKADNPDRNQEIFLATVDLQTRAVTAQQVTRSDVDVINDQPVINAVGDHLAFVSNTTRPLTTGSTVSNPDGNRELFLGRLESGGVTLRQLTTTTNGDNGAPVISDQGHRLAFVSSANGLPGVPQINNSAGIEQVIAAAIDDAGSTRFVSLSANLKKPNGCPTCAVAANEPSISSDGRRIVFVAPGCAPNQLTCAINPSASQVIVADENRLSPGVYFLGQATGFDEIQANEAFRRPAVAGDGRSLAVTFQGIGATYSGIEFLACPVARVILSKDFTVDSVMNAPQVDPKRPDVGDRVIYDVSLVNDSSTVFGARLRITDTLPMAQMTFISATVVSGQSAFEQQPVQSGNRLVWEVKDIPPQTAATVRVAMRVNAGRAGATIVNSAMMTVATESQSGQALIENLETESTLRVTRVDLSARLDVSTQIPREDVPFDYTVTVTNAAGMDPATNVRVIDTAPLIGDFQLDSATPSLGSYNPANHTWTIPVLSGGQTATLRLRVRAKAGAGGKPPMTTTIGAPTSDQEDVNNANNIAVGTRSVRVLGTDLQVLSKTVDTGNRNPPQGAVVTYTIRLRNNGPLSATDAIYQSNQAAFIPAVVEVTDALPAGVAFVSASDSGAFNANTGAVVWRIAGPPAGGEKNLTLRVRAIADPGTLISNQVNNIVGLFSDGGVMNDVVPANDLPSGDASFIVNQGAGVQVVVAPVTMPENTVVAATVSYTDPDLVDTHVVAIFWGDGATQSTPPITRGGVVTGTAIFTHTYADDDADDRYTIVAVVTDSTGNVASGSRVVTVTNVAPTLNPLVVSGQVRNLAANHFLVTTSNTLQVKADFSDPGFSGPPGSETFTYQVDWGDGQVQSGAVTDVTNGKTGIPTTGRFILSHQFAQLGVHTVVVTARDDDGDQAQRSFTVTVNNAPRAHDDAVSVNEDSTVSGNMLANDRPDGDAFPTTTDILTVTQVVATTTQGVLVSYDPTSGAFTYSAAGKFDHLALGQSAADSFTYFVRDLFAFTSTARVNVTVSGVNDAPVLALNATSRPFVEDMGNVTLAAGLTITDIDNGSLISRALVTITNPFDGAAEKVLAMTTRPGVSASYANGVLTLNGLSSLDNYRDLLRSVVYTNTDDTPNLTTRVISFVVLDEHDAASSQPTLSVTVQDKNDAPIIALSPFTPTEDIPFLIGGRVQVVDPDAVINSLRLTATVQHGNLTLPGAVGDGMRQVVITADLSVLNNLNLTYLGDADYTGDDSLTVRVNDLGHNPSGPLSDVETQPFFVLSVDDAPRVDLVSVVPDAMSENTLVSATVVYTDPDANELRTIVVDWGDGTTASTITSTNTSATRVFTHTYADDDGDDRYTVLATVTDSTMLTGGESAPVTVTNVLPTLEPLTLTGTAKETVPDKDVVATTNTPLIVRGSFSDPGFTRTPGQEVFTTTVNWGDGLVETLPVTITVNGKAGVTTTGVFTRTHLYTTYDVFTATVTVFDDDDPTGDTESFRVTVSDIPASGDDFFTLDEDSKIGGNVLDNDGKSGPDDDLDILSVNLNGTLGQVSNVVAETGAFSYTAAGFFEVLALNELAADSFQYTAINKVGFTNTATANFTVVGVNDAPALTLNATSRPFVEDMGNVTLAPALAVSDIDHGALISSALITIVNPLDGAAERLIAVVSIGGINASYANGVLTLDGLASLASYQTLLRSVVYTNTDDTPNLTTRVISFVVLDEHDAASSLRTLNVTVQDKNDAPIVVLSPFTATEDIALNIHASIRITDVDALDGALKLTVSALHGRLSVTASPGVTVTINNAKNVEMLGTLANLRSLLAGAGVISYLSDPDYFGADTLTVTLNDQGHTPSGPLSDTETLNFSVTAVNDAPVIGPIAPPVTFIEDQPAVKIAPNVAITDVDSANLVTATVTLAATPDDSLESLATTVSGGMIAGYDPASRTLTISGSASRTAYQTALRNVTYHNASNIPNLAPRNATFTIWDNLTAASNVRSQTINVQAANDSPTIALSGATPNVEEGGPAVVIDAGMVVSDTDTPILTGGGFTATVVGGVASADFVDIAVAGGITLSGNQVLYQGTQFGMVSGQGSTNMTVSLNGNASLAAVNALARNVTYRRGDKGKPPASIGVRFQVSDGVGGVSNQATKTVNIGGVNDAPEISITTFSPAEDTLFTFVSTVAITDFDAENGTLLLTVTVNSGVLTATGDSDANPRQVVIAATLATLKTRLAAMTYLSDLNFNGADLLSVTLNDQGNTGSGGAKTTTATQSFTVSPVNDAPTVQIMPISATEDTALDIRSNITISDVDAGGSSLRITITVQSGTLSASGLTVASGGGTGTLVVSGSLDQFAAATITYAPALNVNGPVTLGVTANDQGATGSGSAKSDSEPGTITLSAVNDAPTVTIGVIPANEDVATNIRPGVVISDVDSAAGSLRITMTVASGTLAASGFTPVSGNGTATLVILRTLAEYGTSIINYTPPANFVGDVALTVTANDQGATGSGGAKSGADSGTISVTAGNDAPTVQIGAINVTEDTPLDIRPGVTISDADAGGAALRITVTVASGTLTPGGGLTVISGSGTGTLVVTGSLAQFAAATLTYAPALNVNGNVALGVTVNDQGASGDGGPRSGNANGTINIAAVNDAPTVTVTSFDVDEDTTNNVRGFITINDVDVGGATMRFTMTVSSGNLSVSGLTVVSGNGSNSVVATGSLVQFNAAVIDYTPLANSSGAVTLSAAVNDQGATGSGGAKSASNNGTITVNPVNDTPMVQITSISMTEDTPKDIRSDIAISDVDAGSASLRITITVQTGTLSASGLTVVSGNGTGTIVVTGSLAQFAAATITYTPALNVTGGVQLGVTANDQGATGGGGAKSGGNSGTITIAAVNDAPTVQISAFGVNEDTTTNIRPFIVIDDVDAASASLRITVTVTSGTLSVSGLSSISGNGTATVAATGNLAAFNASTINYTPVTNFIGNVTLGVTANDQGATGSGGAKSGNNSFVFSVSNANDLPVLDLNGPAPGTGFGASFTEDLGSVAIASPNLTLVDVDSVTIFSATVRITNLLDGSSEVLLATNVGAVISSYSNGMLTLSGPASLDDFEETLRTVRYNNVSQNPNTTPRSILFLVKDPDGGVSNPVNASVSVAAVNDPPSILLPSGVLNVVEDDPAAQIDSAAQVSDVDSTALTSGGVFTVTVQSGTDSRDKLSIGAFESISVSGSNVRFGGSNIGVHSGLDKTQIKVTLNNGVTIAQAQALARAFTYRQEEGPDIPSRTIQFEIKENGAAGQGIALKSVTITTSEPPVIVLGGTTTSYAEGSPAVAIAPSLTVDDSDSTNMTAAAVQIVNLLDAGQESLAATGSSGITPSYNPATGVLTLSGASNKGNYETVLRSVTYLNSSQNPNSTARLLRFTVTDNQSLTSAPVTATLGIVGVNDAPTLLVNPHNAVEDTSSNIRPRIVISDLDAAGGSLRITVTVEAGALTASGLSMISGGGTTNLVVGGSLAQYATSLITYTPPVNFSGLVNLNGSVSDQGFTGSGGPKSAIGGNTITVAAVDDPPMLATNTGITVTTPLTTGVVTVTLPAGTLRYSDIDSPASSIVYTLTQKPLTGTLLLNATPIDSNSNFTQDDIDQGRLRYSFNAATPQPFTTSFKFRVRGEVGLPERSYVIRVE